MKNNYFLKRMVPAVLGVAAMVLSFAVPTAGAIERHPMQMGFQPQWYDPQAWFERGGPLQHEADWYDYTFAYTQKGVHGYLGAYGEPLPFGYFEDRSLKEPALHYDSGMDLNYYTTDWYNREGMLEQWF